jgi:two-component system nitrate/nitrite response regulator NarL
MAALKDPQCACPAQITQTLDSSREEVSGALATLLVLLDGCIDHTNSEERRLDSEEILLDTELDGCRYLLLRTSRPQHVRIHLSPREREIVRMVAKGHPNKVIADVLNISSWTVNTHLRRIFAKLGVTSRAAMVGELLQIGILNS